MDYLIKRNSISFEHTSIWFVKKILKIFLMCVLVSLFIGYTFLVIVYGFLYHYRMDRLT